MIFRKPILALALAGLFGASTGCVDRHSTAASPSTSAVADPTDPGPASPDEKNRAVEASKAAAVEPPEAKSPRAVAAPRNERTRNLSFDDIKFEMDKEERFERSMLTPAIEKLDGAKIRIRGYILPSFQNEGITNFILVRDNMECCFGPGAALYDCIVVEMAPGNSIEYTVRPVAVEGVFTVREVVDEVENRHLAIYHMTADKVK